MPRFSSFALQFSGFAASSLSATAAELLIVEAGASRRAGDCPAPCWVPVLMARARKVPRPGDLP